MYFNLSTCPRIGKPHKSHNATSTALVLTASGSLGFQCNSSGCEDYKLGAFLKQMEKDHGVYDSNLWLVNLTSPDFEQPLAEEWVKNNQRTTRRTEEGEWFGYSAGIWTSQDSIRYPMQMYLKSLAGDEVEGLSKSQHKIRRQLLSRNLTGNITYLAECNPKLRIEASQFDKDPLLAGLPGGKVLDLQTGGVRLSVPEDFISKAFKVMPGRAEEAPKWLEFLRTTHPDQEIREFLQRFFGLCLTGLTRDNILVFFTDMSSADGDGFMHGNGGRGKGTMLHPFSQIMGPYYRPLPLAAISSDASSDRHDTSLANLPGARLAVLTETPAKSSKHQSATFSNEALKKLSGGDRRISYRKMRGNPGEFDPVFKPVILANKPPRLDEVEEAIVQRILVVPFTQTFRGTSNENTKLKEQLDKELPGILAWGVEGCQKYLETGLQAPPAIKAASKAYAEEADSFEAWLQEATEAREESWSVTRSMYMNWKGYCSDRGLEASDEKWFAASLREHRTVRAKAKRVGGKLRQGFEGIRLLYCDEPQDMLQGNKEE